MVYLFRRWRSEDDRSRRLRRGAEEISGYARNLEAVLALSERLRPLGWERIKPAPEEDDQ